MRKPPMILNLREALARLKVRVAGAEATLSLLRDLGMATKEHEHSHSYLKLRVAAIEQDIAILEQGYASKESR